MEKERKGDGETKVMADMMGTGCMDRRREREGERERH